MIRPLRIETPGNISLKVFDALPETITGKIENQRVAVAYHAWPLWFRLVYLVAFVRMGWKQPSRVGVGTFVNLYQYVRDF